MRSPCFSRLALKLTLLDHRQNRLADVIRESQEVNPLAIGLDILKLGGGVVVIPGGELQIRQLTYLRSIRFLAQRFRQWSFGLKLSKEQVRLM